MQKLPLRLCGQCGAALIAPIWSERQDERYVRNLWSCDGCSYQFESTVYSPQSNIENHVQSVPVGSPLH